MSEANTSNAQDDAESQEQAHPVYWGEGEEERAVGKEMSGADHFRLSLDLDSKHRARVEALLPKPPDTACTHQVKEALWLVERLDAWLSEDNESTTKAGDLMSRAAQHLVSLAAIVTANHELYYGVARENEKLKKALGIL